MNKQRYKNTIYSYYARSRLDEMTYAAIIKLRKRSYYVCPHGLSHHKVRPWNGASDWRNITSATLRAMV
tara:strand:- start:1926 stop:2132 length:207 start_codon:yes stop_codon:yes gene_type:complete